MCKVFANTFCCGALKMKMRTLYQVDQKLLGIVVGVLGRLIQRRRSHHGPAQWKCIAISKYVGMGSIVLATPLLKAIRRACNAKVMLVTLKQHEELARILRFDGCLSLDISSLRNLLRSSLLLISSLRRHNFDAFFELEFFSNAAALIAFLSGAKIRAGFHHAQSPRGKLLTHTLPVTPRHASQLFLALAWATGVEVSFNEMPERPWYDMNKVNRYVKELPRPFIGVNPNAGELSLQRRWHGERFREIILRLLDSFPELHICVIGAPNEAAYVGQLLDGIEGHERLHNLAGKLNLHELCMLLDEALILLTNDSGPMHIAAALGTPCVAIFGPESPTHYAPLGEGHRIIYKALPCSPCLNPYDGKMFVCPFGRACMDLISADEVFDEAASLIERVLRDSKKSRMAVEHI